MKPQLLSILSTLSLCFAQEAPKVEPRSSNSLRLLSAEELAALEKGETTLKVDPAVEFARNLLQKIEPNQKVSVNSPFLIEDLILTKRFPKHQFIHVDAVFMSEDVPEHHAVAVQSFTICSKGNKHVVLSYNDSEKKFFELLKNQEISSIKDAVEIAQAHAAVLRNEFKRVAESNRTDTGFHVVMAPEEPGKIYRREFKFTTDKEEKCVAYDTQLIRQTK